MPDFALNSTTTSTQLIGIGAGGHSRVMIALASRCGFQISCLLEKPTIADKEFSVDSVPVIYETEERYLASYYDRLHRSTKQSKATNEESDRHPPQAVICIGTANTTQLRVAIHERLVKLGYSLPNLIDPTTIREQAVEIGNGVHILSGVILAAGARLGDNVLVNHRVTVEHDCVVDQHVHLASGVVLCGGVHVGAQTLVGAGSVVLPGVHIGEGCVIGAGSTVTRNVPAGEMVMGNPARQRQRCQAA
ncbi:sugar O-acyltransferase, sialic acid O-acetyltransferase NeuD family [Neorhodopirellula lusitana]|uniref:Sugar O-acyltransferase, sialic acid O-acetyltransferase NeuD family n=1 Tax=Neorhodopirellula lusitana TaxID=445327 RepID=A0ABY1PTV5_9BACT|nr:acetyltransferase [Neorhodopirellula lusitana]SMP47678.1 sugar O-acyltransferase, sialic acid O-acetyltransferase NeuD family [Neorhodopirellula lusitana]